MSASGAPGKPTRVDYAKREVVDSERKVLTNLSEFVPRARAAIGELEASSQGKKMQAPEKAAIQNLKELVELCSRVASLSETLLTKLLSVGTQEYSQKMADDIMSDYKAMLNSLVDYAVLYEHYNALEKEKVVKDTTLAFLNSKLLPGTPTTYTFQSNLVQPMQRIMRYTDLFKAVLKELPPESPERAIAQQFINEALESAARTNESIRNDQKLRQTEQRTQESMILGNDPGKWKAFLASVAKDFEAGIDVNIGVIGYELSKQVAISKKKGDKRFTEAYLGVEAGGMGLRQTFEQLLSEISNKPASPTQSSSPSSSSPASSSLSSSEGEGLDELYNASLESPSSGPSPLASSSSSQGDTTDSLSLSEEEQELSSDIPVVQPGGWGRTRPTAEQRTAKVHLGDRPPTGEPPQPAPTRTPPPVPSTKGRLPLSGQASETPKSTRLPLTRQPAVLNLAPHNENLSGRDNAGRAPAVGKPPPVPPLPPIQPSSSSSSPSSPSGPSSSSGPGWKTAEKPKGPRPGT